MVTVEKLPIVNLILMFIFYIVAHSIIAWMMKKSKETYDKNLNNEKYARFAKNWELAFKWFPAVYLIVVVLLMLMF